jgi:hypothetical protein
MQSGMAIAKHLLGPVFGIFLSFSFSWGFEQGFRGGLGNDLGLENTNPHKTCHNTPWCQPFVCYIFLMGMIKVSGRVFSVLSQPQVRCVSRFFFSL